MTDDMTPLPITRDDDGIVTLALTPNPKQTRGGVVVLDSWLLEAIDGTIDAIFDGPDPTGLILSSQSERVFVAGADLAEIDSLDDEREASTGAVPHAPQLPPAAPPPARSHDGESVRAAGSTSDSAEGEERPPKRLNKGKGKAKVS